MMKNAGLAAKIFLGFGLLIAIAVLLGGLAVYNMNTVRSQSDMLAKEYVPEVDIASDLERNALLTMYNMRGWGLTEEQTYFDEGTKYLDEVHAGLEDAAQLAEEAEHLVKLREHLKSCTDNVAAYKGFVDQTAKTLTRMDEQRRVLDSSAQAYMQNCNQLVDKQKTLFQEALKTRQEKIRIVSQISDLGAKVRVTNFKAQATGDAKLMEEAIETLAGLKTLTDSLRPITKDAEDIQRIDDTEKAAEAYSDAMTTFGAEFRKGNAADAALLSKSRSAMDDAAAVFVTNCAEFLAGQQQKLTRDMQERTGTTILAYQVIDTGNQIRLAAWRSQAQRTPELIEGADTHFDSLTGLFGELRDVSNTDEDLELIDATEKAASQYRKAMSAFLQDWLTLQDISKERNAAAEGVLAATQATARAGMEQTTRISHSAAASLSRSSTIMIVGLLIALLLGVAVALTLTRSITGPVRKVIEGLNQGAQQVTQASGQVAQSSQSMSEGASEQASSLEETSASLEEMASMTRQNADNANQANTMAGETSEAARKGQDAMNRMADAINRIKSSSDETAKIIKTIDEIAFQTNLLALNAAVEAARAGDAGKGFAVVAEEVRNLAQRSAEAAKDTSQLIEESQQNADDGVAVSQEVAELLTQIGESVNRVAQLIHEVTAASNEQAQGIDQVNTAVSQMDQVTQSNAANSEEAASAAEELSAQARELNDMVAVLVGIVGGAAGHDHGNGRPKLGTPANSSAVKNDEATPKLPGANEQRVALTPKDVIPLDDEDMSDF